MDISLLDLNGFTGCTPSDSTSPVTRPKRVSTPTFPDSTFATDENSNSATKNPTTAIPSRRNAGLGFTSITLPRPSEKIVIVIPPHLDCSLDTLAPRSEERRVGKECRSH